MVRSSPVRERSGRLALWMVAISKGTLQILSCIVMRISLSTHDQVCGANIVILFILHCLTTVVIQESSCSVEQIL